MPTEALAGTAVGLVVGRLEDVRDPQLGADFLHLPGDVQAHLLGLRHARSGNQEERLIQPNVESTQFHPGLLQALLALRAIAALT
ncbi:hypothetical protein SDC9_206114 [bioreactor metagenome]|uniref:AXH domain-containing protein n=1 Tax=bioreactor metagenome TaxID=1076179 RepID=A0A645J6T9_9ZZZZ